MNAQDELIEGLLARALAAADESGVMLVNDRPDVLGVDSKSTITDVVTDMDRRSEALIIDRLLDGRSEDATLGEESSERAGTSGVRWVIDPIDGTVNYLYDLPGWAVCIGIELDGESVGGVVRIPTVDETYWAIRGQGAFSRSRAGRRQLHVSGCTDLSMALVATGFGYAPRRRAAQAQVLTELLPNVRDIRRMGSAGADLCWLAAGRFDGYFERGLKEWDLCAAGVIAREAGAVVGGVRGAGPSEELVIAANPGLFPLLADTLAELNADSDAYAD